MKKNFDIYDYVHKNKFDLLLKESKYVNHVAKGYNDIRKTNLKDIKITDGKFNLKENLDGDKPVVDDHTKKLLLDLISSYNTYQKQMQRPSDIVEVSNTLGGILEAAKQLTLSEADDWFDAVTIKRNMGELDKLGKQFDKVCAEAKALDERLHALYDDMGNILNRYYDISDIPEETMKERLGMKENIKKKVNESFNHIIEVDTPTQIVSKPIRSQIEALAKKGVRSKDIGLKMNFTGNAKLATDTFQKVKNEIYFALDKRESVNKNKSLKNILGV